MLSFLVPIGDPEVSIVLVCHLVEDDSGDVRKRYIVLEHINLLFCFKHCFHFFTDLNHGENIQVIVPLKEICEILEIFFLLGLYNQRVVFYPSLHFRVMKWLQAVFTGQYPLVVQAVDQVILQFATLHILLLNCVSYESILRFIAIGTAF